MLILTIRSDKPEAELGLYNDSTQISYETWEAHRLLAETIHQKIDYLLKQHDKSIHDLAGIVGYRGPGSFTGLRIGLTVANTFADGLGIPIVGTDEQDWITSGIERLKSSQNDKVVVPEYGAPVHITPQKR